MSLSKQEDYLHAQTAVSCSICDNETPGEHFCFDCSQTLCSNCKSIHGKVASSKNHNVVLRAQMGEKYRKSVNCSDHEMTVTFYCTKCKIQVCVKCVTDEHKGHEMSDLDVIFQQRSEELRKYTKVMRDKVLPTLRMKGEELKEGKDNYEKKIDQIQQQMEEDSKAQHKEFDVIYNERLKMLLKRKEADLSVFDGYVKEINSRIEKTKGKITDYQRAISNKSLPNVIEFAKSVEPLLEIGRIPEFPKPPSFLPGNINTLKENVGYLKISSGSIKEKTMKNQRVKIISRFQSPLKGWPSICITKKGSVLLGGEKSKQVVMVNKSGQILWRRNVQFSPTALAVLESGEIILAASHTESTTIRRLTPSGNEEVVFTFKTTHCNGLSVTPDERILLSTKDGRVMRTNSDHDKVTLLYDGKDDNSAVHAVEDSDGNVYITDFFSHAVVILKKDETTLTLKRTTKAESFGELKGMTVDAEGNILCADITKNCIYLIDRTRQAQKLVDSSHGVQRPRFLAVDNENNLWVTQYDGSILVVRYE